MNSLLPSVIIIFQQSLLYVTQQFLVVTSKVKRNCNYTCQQSLPGNEAAISILPLICLHFLLLIAIYFSKVHYRNALRNLCCAWAIFSIHTHILGPCMGKNIFSVRATQSIRVYSLATLSHNNLYIHASLVHFPP